MTTEKILSPKEWHDKYLKENNKINATPFGLFDANSMELYAKYYALQVAERAVEEELKGYDLSGGVVTGTAKRILNRIKKETEQ